MRLIRANAAWTTRGPPPDSEDQRVEHSVWDEPGISSELAGAAPPDALTYRAWLEKRTAATSAAKSWLITLGIALLAGPWALFGAFWGSGRTGFSIVALVVFGPAVEEVMKIALSTYVIEKKPFLFRSALQVALCAVAGALVFASVENLLYLNVYIHGPTEAVVYWRWTVCLALHMGCSLVAAMGLMRVWKDIQQRRGPPRLTLAYPYLVAAIVMHGVYNGFAVILSLSDYRF